MLALRPYQEPVKQDVMDALAQVRAVLLVMATGSGKTVVFSSIMHDHVGSAAAVVHRREIVGQIAISLAKLGVKHRIIAPPKTIKMIRQKQLRLFGRSFVDPHAKCGVISVQTLTSKATSNNEDTRRWLSQITLCVFDEGHHYVQTGHWAKAVGLMCNAKLLFVTATPTRADGKGLGSHADGFVDTMVEGPGTRELIASGYLAPFRYFCPGTDLDVEGVRLTATGDVNTQEVRQRIIRSHFVGDLVEHYQRFAAGLRTIVFANDVATAFEHAEAFRQAGVEAVALHGGTEEAERDRELSRFENGPPSVLINVDLFDEGFDVPGVEAVILARVTESLAKYLQMIGRGLRSLEGKAEAIIIDPVRNWERHGLPIIPRVWSLDRRDKQSRTRNAELVPQKICTNCTQPFEAFYKVCPYCGTEPMPGGRARPDQVDGDLLELDLDALSALLDDIARADMPDEAYRFDQIRRNIPPIGRPPDLKRHRAAKYRRTVLRELIAWWYGMQPSGRELGEKHRRFYHRFGVDVGTALTLNATDTDALIARMQLNFTEDMR